MKTMNKFAFALASAFGLCGFTAADGLKISEICPRPTSPDPNGMESGWVELYNDSDSAINLRDYEIVRVNRGKVLKAAGRSLAPRTVPARGYAVVYMSEEYPNALDEESADYDKVIVAANDVMVVPQKVSPKKFPVVALYNGKTLVEKVVVPVDLPDNQSIAPCGPAASYAGSGDAKATIVNAANVRSVILPTITKGTANNLTGAIPYGPNIGPLAGVKHSFTDLAAAAPATPGQPYTVTFAVNPVTDDAADAITGVSLITRVWSVPATGSDDNRQKSAAQASHEYVMAKGDVVEGQGQLWTVAIPAADLPAPGQLLQWAAIITEQSGNSWRSPSFRNSDDGYEWYGTITAPDAGQISPTLQTWHLYVTSGDYWKVNSNQSGYRCRIYDSSTSNYYDNVEIGTRGNSTANTKNCNKLSHTLKFSKCKPMVCTNPFDGEEIETRKTSLLAELADPSRLRSCLSFYVRRKAGMDVPFCYPVRVQLNGVFYQLDMHTNRFKDELLVDYFGYDEKGYALKNVGTLGGNNMSGGMTYELPEGDLAEAQDAFENARHDGFRDICKKAVPPTKVMTASEKAAVDAYVAGKFDLPAWFNYLAMSCICQENDDSWANLCLYCDARGTGTWRPMAYDVHQSWGVWFRFDSYGTALAPWASEDKKGKSHPLFGGLGVMCDACSNMGWANRGFEAVFQNEKYRRLYLRRLRTLMDEIFMEPGTPKEETEFWRDYAMPLVEAMRADDGIDRARWLDKYNGKIACALWVWDGVLSFDEGVEDLWDNYIVPRRVHLFQTHCVSNTAKPVGYGNDYNAGIPLRQSPLAQLKDGFSVEAVPGGAVIRNANAETVDVSGWKLSGPIALTMPAGTVIDQQIDENPGELFVVTDRIAYTAANAATITNQIIVGNAKAGSGDQFALETENGESVLASVSPMAAAIRLHSFDGVTTSADGDSGEWIALTNLDQTASFDLAGLRIVILKDGDTEPKCDFVIPDETVIEAGGVVRLEQDACGWTKITNNKIHIYLYDTDGATPIQISETITQKNFATYYGEGGPGGEACLVATSFAIRTTGENWIASDFVVPPTPPSAIYSGVYDETVTIAEPGSYTLSNATFSAGLVLGNGTYVLKNVKDTVNTASQVTSTGTIVFKQGGTFELTGTGAEPLMTVFNLFVSNGTFRVDYASATAKSKAVNVTGSFAVEDEGAVDVTVGGVQNYGLYIANKDQFCRIGDGGAFRATVDGSKCAALYGNKGSVDAEVMNGATIEATLTGAEARVFNFAGKIKLKGGDISVTGNATDAKAFKSDKSISVKDGVTVDISLSGTGSEAFSCADTFEMSGGVVEIVSGDDCVGAETNVTIKGGMFYGYSTGNDVFDTNEGDIKVSGGLVLAYTTAQEEGNVGSFGFDVNDNQVKIDGGIVVAIGGDNLKGAHFPAIAGSQASYIDEDVPSATYSGKYISYSVCGTNTTVGLPAIDSGKCSILFSVPGMDADAAIGVAASAPSVGALDFHEVYYTEPEPFALGELASRPMTDYNGNYVTLSFTGDIPPGADIAAAMSLNGIDYAAADILENGLIVFEIPADAVTAGNTYNGAITVAVGGQTFTRALKLEQGTFKLDENTDWIAETVNGFGTTGTWTGFTDVVDEGVITLTNATFTAAKAAPRASVVTISTVANFGGVAEEPFDLSKRAGIRVVKAGGVNRYAVLTADGVVTNLDFVAEVKSSVEVQMILDEAGGTVSYSVGGRQQLGTFPMAQKAAGVSTVAYVGGTEITSLFGTYRFEGLDSNLAKAGGVEFATVADAIAADAGDVELLWDTSWNPAAEGDYTFAKNGHELVIGGDLAYEVTDNGDGTVTVTVAAVAEPEGAVATSITIAGTIVKIGVRDIVADSWYALEKTTDLNGDFVIDAATWTKGADLLEAGGELAIALVEGEPHAFYRVVVSKTAP